MTGAEVTARLESAFRRNLTALESEPALTEIERSERLREIWRLVEESGLTEDPRLQPAHYELLVWDLAGLAPQPGARRGDRWHPRSSYSDGSAYPDVASLQKDEQFLAYLSQRLQETASLVHRARYADILWEFRGNYRHAITAARSYLEGIPERTDDAATRERHDAITRALQLATSLKRHNLVRAAIRALLDELDTSAAEDFPYPCFDLLHWLLEMPEHAVNAEDLMAGRRYAEAAAAHYDRLGGLDLLALNAAQEAVAAFARRLGDREGEWQAQLAIGATIEQFATTQAKPSATAEAFMLQRALAHFTRIGAKAEADRLRPKLRATYKAGEAEYGTLHPALQSSFAEADRYAESLATLAPVRSLARFLDDVPHYPRRSDLEAQADSYQEHAVLAGYIPRHLIRDGRQVDAAGTPEEQRAWAVGTAYYVWASLQAPTLARIYRRLADAERWTADSVADFLASGVAFDADKLPLVRAGIERYFARDYISAIHVLVPQIEDILRRLLDKVGGVTTTQTNTGATIEVTLEKVLTDPAIRHGLGEDWCRYLEFLFTEQYGPNLRAHVAYGILQGSEAQEPLATLVLDTLVGLRSLALGRDEGGGCRIAPDAELFTETAAPSLISAIDPVALPRAAWIRVITDRIVHEFHPLQVILFGSHARGEARPDSDVDLFVVLAAVDDKRRQARAIRAALADVPVPQDVLVTTPAEIGERGDVPNTALYHALREGRVLFDRG